MSSLDYMLDPGFFGTRAPLFMDIVSLIVITLPFLMLGIIYLAKVKKYKLHALLQIILFIVSVCVLIFFEIGVRYVGGFKSFMEASGVKHNYALIVLIFHIFISVSTIVIWIRTLLVAKKQVESGQAAKHKKLGILTFIGVVMIVFTGGWVYFLMFVY